MCHLLPRVQLWSGCCTTPNPTFALGVVCESWRGADKRPQLEHAVSFSFKGCHRIFQTFGPNFTATLLSFSVAHCIVVDREGKAQTIAVTRVCYIDSNI
jgi:hypothetical protein